MKDRFLTFALAAGAFALFYVLMAPKPQPPQERPTRPVSIEQGPNGYLAMLRWFEAEGLKPLSLRERYGHLAQLTAGASATGNLLISTTPHIYPVRDSEAAPLREWISAGNTLLVVAGLSDTPDWSMGEGIDNGFMEHMQTMTGLVFTQAGAQASAQGSDGGESNKSDEGEEGQGEEDQGEKDQSAAPEPEPPSARDVIAATTKLAEPLRFSMVPNDGHPLLTGVKSVAALSEYPTAQWRASSTMVDLVLELAQDPVTGEPVLWLMRYGKGQIIVSAFGSVFTNKLLGESDNARLLANIVKWSRGAAGQVIIDDAHQGLVAFYDPDAFFGDKRLHYSLWWLLGLWLVFVLGPQRLRAAATGWNPVDITSFVRASGGFMARVLRPAAAGQQLFTNFFNDIRRQIGLPANGAPVWDWMTERSTIAAQDVAQLRELHGRVLHNRRIDLPKLQNLLVQVRSNLI